MNLEAAVAGFRNAVPIPGMASAWHWSPAPGIDFAGALSSDGKRLLQLSARDSYERDLAVAVLRFSREHEEAMAARNRYLGSVGGFTPPAGHDFDAVAMASVEVHDFYAFERPELNPVVRVVFPAYSCEFSGAETLDDAETRYIRMLRTTDFRREPVPFLKMRFANTRTLGKSAGSGRGFTEPRVLTQELREIDNAPGSFVEFENCHGSVWRVEWHGAWYIAEWDTEAGVPREIGLDDLLTFAESTLRS
ncbi:hypothetical protein [Streptomyces sp. NPDC047108]|uniref:hypothetical protein n=1 Tax=Streptomyces sp. NPDC047108 TaxID=3155025 RepID=UPI0033D3AC3A